MKRAINMVNTEIPTGDINGTESTHLIYSKSLQMIKHTMYRKPARQSMYNM